MFIHFSTFHSHIITKRNVGLKSNFIDVQIEDNTLHFRELAQSRCGSLDFIDHIPGGGDKKVRASPTIVEEPC